MTSLTSSDGTTYDRLLYLKGANTRLYKFLARAEACGWTVEPSTAAPDTVIVRHPSLRDHFVLYPTGVRRTASLSVYDGRDGYEFAPLPARNALAYISSNRKEDQ